MGKLMTSWGSHLDFSPAPPFLKPTIWGKRHEWSYSKDINHSYRDHNRVLTESTWPSTCRACGNLEGPRSAGHIADRPCALCSAMRLASFFCHPQVGDPILPPPQASSDTVLGSPYTPWCPGWWLHRALLQIQLLFASQKTRTTPTIYSDFPSESRLNSLSCYQQYLHTCSKVYAGICAAGSMLRQPRFCAPNLKLVSLSLPAPASHFVQREECKANAQQADGLYGEFFPKSKERGDRDLLAHTNV